MALRAVSIGLLVSQIGAIPALQPYASAPPNAVLPSVASTSTATASSQLDQLASFALNVTTEKVSNRTTQKRDGCTRNKLRVRREWRTLSNPQRRAFIDAILCLQQLPSQTPPEFAPGAKTRYDDFIATHINQTAQIHFTGTFLGWHRYFLGEFEQALRSECGYTGDYPYWNWPDDTERLEVSPIFDGSDTSFSGNGAPIPNQPPNFALTMGDRPPIWLPTGSGGGCITDGPFKNYTLNLGPAGLALPGGERAAAPNPLAYNPRCLKRDLTSSILRQFSNATAVVELLLKNRIVYDFQTSMQGTPGSGGIGVHGGGHYSMGGDPGRDVFTSPGDPAFWVHHGMVDRLWWIWQSLDWGARWNAISGTGTFLNEPPSPNTTLETMVDIGFAGSGGPVAMEEIMSTTAGPFCYVYL
ncbi:putative tyrosinase [Aspergillus taichungensis]|uniref:Putative tyrosinase n=1 Tax=Aspergillus taichungensis TaxID=482145 RepID=A0A2J5HDB0_9EURO|nr:putative tyrosinase [Aspergillus taichungensis]